MTVLNHMIPWSTQVRYIGVVLDRGLIRHDCPWRSLCQNFHFLVLNPLINSGRPELRYRLLLYKTCARFRLLYTTPIWAPAHYHLKILQIIQNKFLRVILGFPKNTNSFSLHNEAHMENIDLIINNMVSKIYKMSRNTSASSREVIEWTESKSPFVIPFCNFRNS